MKMKIIIELVSINKGGAEQVAVSFLNECRMREKNQYHVFLRDNIKTQVVISSFPDNFKFYDFSERPGQSLASYLRVIREFNRLANDIGPDCVVSTGGHCYWNPMVPFVCGFNIPHYIYPESPYFNGLTLKKKLYWLVKTKVDFYYYRRADALFVQTDEIGRAHV